MYLQIHFPALDIRLSYNDIQLFLAIAKSIPTAATPVASRSETSQSLSSKTSEPRTEGLKDKSQVVTGTSGLIKWFWDFPTH